MNCPHCGKMIPENQRELVLGLWRQEFTRLEIAERLGCSKGLVSKYLKSCGIGRTNTPAYRPTEKLIARVQKLRDEGETWAEIARKIKKPYEWTHRWMVPLMKERPDETR